MARAIRFGLHLWRLPTGDWTERLRHYERLGFSTITFTDHVVVPQHDPIAAAGAVIGATTDMHAGSLVMDMGIRNPVLVAKAAASLHVLSGGRFELGLGAGYLKANFDAAGLPWIDAVERLARLDEAIELIRRIWTDETTTLSSNHFTVRDMPRALPEAVSVPILVGGGGPKVMALGGRRADIVSLIPRQSTGDWSVPDSMEDSTDERLATKATWVRDAAREAGRDPDDIELNTMVFRTSIGNDADARRKALADADAVDVDALASSSLYLTGTNDDVRELLLQRRDSIGLTYYSFFDPSDDQIEQLSSVLESLDG